MQIFPLIIPYKNNSKPERHMSREVTIEDHVEVLYRFWEISQVIVRRCYTRTVMQGCVGPLLNAGVEPWVRSL